MSTEAITEGTSKAQQCVKLLLGSEKKSCVVWEVQFDETVFIETELSGYSY